MNRLVIVGNGLDLAINMKTSYKQFICGFFKKIDNDYKSYQRTKHLLFEISGKGVPGRALHLDNPNEYAKSFLDIKSPLLEETLRNIEEKGWTDIERDYYKLLIRIFDGKNPYRKDKKEKEVSILNSELESIYPFRFSFLNS